MYPFSSSVGNYDYLEKQYLRFWEGSFKVGQEFSEIWLNAWQEAFQSPATLMKRNFDYWQEVVRPPEAAWQTYYQEVSLPPKLAKIVRLLDFSGVSPMPGEVIPTLILPPQAGHHSYIADYSPEQSQIQALRQNGLDKIYCIEWLPATQETKHTRIEDYVEGLRYAIQLLGGRANLIGDCQGGWLSAIFAGLYPEMVNTLTIAGAPIDFQAGNGQIKEAVNYYAQTFPERGLAFYRGLVQLGNGVLDGRMMVAGFDIMKPGQTPLRYLNLYKAIHDPVQLERFREMKNWYDFTQSIGGDFYLWLVAHLFRDNELIAGKLIVGGRRVDLKKITCPLFLIGGTRDHVTPPEQVFAMAKYVGTHPDQVQQYLVEAGHIGLFMGKDILINTWSEVAGKVEAYSNVNQALIA